MSKLIERDGKKFVEVGPNDSLGSIAFEHAGHSNRWRELLRCNQQQDPNGPAVPGTLLELPEAWTEVVPDLEPMTPESFAATVAGGGNSPHILEDVVRKVLGEWAEHAEKVIEDLKDKIGLLEMKRDQDQQRLAEQGAKILTLESQVRELAGKANTAPPVEEGI